MVARRQICDGASVGSSNFGRVCGFKKLRDGVGGATVAVVEAMRMKRRAWKRVLI